MIQNITFYIEGVFNDSTARKDEYDYIQMVFNSTGVPDADFM